MGRRIALARSARQWDQSQLARKAGVSPSYISRLESGSRPKPSMVKLKAIAEALGMTVSQLDGSVEPLDENALREQLVALVGPEWAPTIERALRVVALLPPEDKRMAAQSILSQALGVWHQSRPGEHD